MRRLDQMTCQNANPGLSAEATRDPLLAKSRHVAGPSQDACLDELESSRRPFGRRSLAQA